MAGNLLVRLKCRAARHGRSIEAEHRGLLCGALAVEPGLSFDTLAAEMRKLTRGWRQAPSEELQREGR